MATTIRPSQIILIPFDPESDLHVERLVNQRKACGWNHEKIPLYQEMQREGKKGIHWITISPLDPTYRDVIEIHTSQYPDESTPLVDTARHLHGKSRAAPTSEIEGNSIKEFIPIGHLSIDTWSPVPDLADVSLHTYVITLLYISRALHSLGLGFLSMKAVEKFAVKELGAKVLTLGTMDKEGEMDERRWEAFGTGKPKVCREDWYGKMGYVAFKHIHDYVTNVDLKGVVWSYRFVFMRKVVGGVDEVEKVGDQF